MDSHTAWWLIKTAIYAYWVFHYGSDFPVQGGYQNSLGGRSDLVVFKFWSNGSSLLAGTYFGGSLNDGLNGNIETGFPVANHWPITTAMRHAAGENKYCTR
jgi:hypothetical protein